MTDKYDEIALRLAQLAGARHQSDHVYATQIAAALRQAVAEERAACLAIAAERTVLGGTKPWREGYRAAGVSIYTAIRSRGSQDK